MGDQVSVELLYNSVKTEVKASWSSSSVGDGEKTRCGRESHIRPKGPSGPNELGSREDADKMQ